MHKPTINDLLVALIKETKEPLAPVIMQNLVDGLENSKVLFYKCDRPKAEEIMQKWMDCYSKDELDSICATPEFITALIVMLKTSLQGFVAQAYIKQKANL